MKDGKFCPAAVELCAGKSQFKKGSGKPVIITPSLSMFFGTATETGVGLLIIEPKVVWLSTEVDGNCTALSMITHRQNSTMQKLS